MRGSTHAHGMAKLKIAPDILDAVAKVYAGRKAADIIEYRTGIFILHFPQKCITRQHPKQVCFRYQIYYLAINCLSFSGTDGNFSQTQRTFFMLKIHFEQMLHVHI